MSDLMDDFFEIDDLDNDQFLRLKETLTRIGLVSRKDATDKPTLSQTCHVLYKQNRYFIVHFKQMFLLDGKQNKTDYTIQDRLRTQKIVEMLTRWNLVKLVYAPDEIENDPNVSITIIPYKEKGNWNLLPKYEIGIKHYEDK